MTHINDMTQKDFRELPLYESWQDTIEDVDSVVVLPERTKHDSGYRCMSYILCKADEVLVRVSSCSDVLHIDGIGGYGPYDQRDGTSVVPAKGWTIDCLPRSGLLRIFCSYRISVAARLSSQSIYGQKKREPQVTQGVDR